ncbi:MAG TPA: ParB/RepB/Spo0J family partition protein [Bacilli bacterium]|nr:ParB/RepB/Spo0J family partition protein [Bacilli bacterium]
MKNDTKKILTTNLSDLIGKYEKSDVLAELEREYLSLPIRQISLQEITTNKYLKNVRYSDKKIRKLIDSYGESLFIEPLVCRLVDEKYEIIIGHEKFLAAKVLNIQQMKVTITNYNDEETLLILLALARKQEQKNIVEFAVLFRALAKEFNYTQQNIARLSYLSRPQVTNIMRLLKLPSDVLKLVQEEKISYGHARALINYPSEKVKELAKLIAKEKLTVREVEKMFAKEQDTEQSPKIVQTGRKVTVFFNDEEEAKAFAAKIKKDND